jgi:capsular polysaccharide transport system permease protein
MKIWTRLSPPTGSSEALGQRDDRRLTLPPAGARLPVAGGLPLGRLHETRPRGGLSGPFRRHPFAWLVLFPTLLAGLYFFLVAAPQYVSEARFMLRGQTRSAGSLLGEALNAGGFRAATEEAVAVRDYLLSHDAVQALHARVDLVATFRRPEADPVSRLWWEAPEAERLLDYYRRQVKAEIDLNSGITELRVRTFRAADSLLISRELLGMGEAMVNSMNRRAQEEALRASRAEQARAEERVAAASAAVTAFRQREQAVDPSRSAALAVETIGRLDGDLARARAELQAAERFARPNSPQVMGLRNRIDALESQAAEERRRLSAAGTGITEQIAGFERLRLEADFAGRALVTANTALERALAEAQRQQLFLVRVVEPNLAERSLYPRPLWATAYVFAALALVYGLAWLLIAGVREHAA